MILKDEFDFRWTEVISGTALSLLLWSLDIHPPYIVTLETGEPIEELPRIGLAVDISFWSLAILCQLITRIYTKLKHPLMNNESSNELFSNISLLVCFILRFIPPILNAFSFPAFVVYPLR